MTNLLHSLLGLQGHNVANIPEKLNNEVTAMLNAVVGGGKVQCTNAWIKAS